MYLSCCFIKSPASDIKRNIQSLNGIPYRFIYRTFLRQEYSILIISTASP